MDPVIVVGAGPVGLALSLALAGAGVPTVVLDEGPGKDDPRPARSVVLHADTAAMAHRLGCTTLRDEGAYFAAWRTMRRGRDSGRITFEDHPTPLHLPQHALTRGLRDAAGAHPLVRLVTDCRLDALEQDERGITAHTRGGETTWWRGSHLVGCDGARSTVRKLLGIRFPGRTAVERHAVAALRTELPWPGEALLHRGADHEVTARPLPDGVWRLDWLLPSRGELVTPDALVTLIRDTLAAWCGGTTPPYDLIDTGVHTLHHRLARRWRDGRAYLAGDAAHLLGALGTQGVEEGLRDAENLAWRLAVAWHQGASEALLDGYEDERRRAVAARLRAADQAMPALRGGGGLRTYLPGAARSAEGLLTDGHLGRGPLGAEPAYAPGGGTGGPDGHGTGRPGGRRPGHRPRRHHRAVARPARAGPAAGAPRRPGHRGVGPPALARRRSDAPARGRGGRAPDPRGPAGRGQLSGGSGTHRAAGTARRTPGGDLRGGPAAELYEAADAVRGGAPEPARAPSITPAVTTPTSVID